MAARCQVGPPAWRRRASFRHRQARHLQDEVIVTVRLLIPGPGIDESRRLDYEKEDYFGFRWWPAPEVLSSSERFYPGQLPALLALSSAKKSMNRSNYGHNPEPIGQSRSTPATPPEVPSERCSIHRS